MQDFNKLCQCIKNSLFEYSFDQYEVKNLFDFKHMAVLRRRTWNTNRAIVIIELSDAQQKNIKNIGKFSQSIKRQLGKEIGYYFWIYPLGLQLVFYGESIIDLCTDVQSYVDKWNNQQVVLQSIHVLENNESQSVRTWGQFATGKYQDIIEKSIKEFQT